MTTLRTRFGFNGNLPATGGAINKLHDTLRCSAPRTNAGTRNPKFPVRCFGIRGLSFLARILKFTVCQGVSPQNVWNLNSQADEGDYDLSV